MVSSGRPITNALTIDLEDWPQSVLDSRLPITDCVVGNTDRVLSLLDRFNVRATFFALGKVCERFPQLLPRIASAGHEIASHGYGHELVHTLTPQRFREDVERSSEIIESQTGRRPIGYRAPAFSFTKDTAWAGPILTDLGIRYSSSVFPIAGRRYGIPDAPRGIHRWPNCDLTEFPITTLRWFGRNFPVAGGGYSRLLPGAVLSGALRAFNREGKPAVVYLHPYELAVSELSRLRRSGWRISPRVYINQSLFRGRIAARLSRLLSALRFAPMADVLEIETEAETPKLQNVETSECRNVETSKRQNVKTSKYQNVQKAGSRKGETG